MYKKYPKEKKGKLIFPFFIQLEQNLPSQYCDEDKF